MAEAPILKQLKIKTAVVQRTSKELISYHKELEQQKAKVAKMRENNADEYDIKKQVEVQAETEVMIPDTMRRLSKAVEDLRGFLAMSENDPAIKDTEQLTLARNVLQEMTSTNDNDNNNSSSSSSNSNGDDDDRI